VTAKPLPAATQKTNITINFFIFFSSKKLFE